MKSRGVSGKGLVTKRDLSIGRILYTRRVGNILSLVTIMSKILEAQINLICSRNFKETILTGVNSLHWLIAGNWFE